MTRLGIGIPVLIRNPEMKRLTLQCIASIRTDSDVSIYLLINGLSSSSPSSFHDEIKQITKYETQLVFDRERNVAASWNEASRLAAKDGKDFLLILGNDTLLETNTVDNLIEFGLDNKSRNCALWSGIDKRDKGVIHNHTIDWEACDFSCFMSRPKNAYRFGEFDENFIPAYFEDNDYYARIVLSGSDVAAVHAAKYYHYGSMTTKTDSNLRDKMRGCFAQNRFYFKQKWGTDSVARTRADVFRNYNKSPWNNHDIPLTWWPKP